MLQIFFLQHVLMWRGLAKMSANKLIIIGLCLNLCHIFKNPLNHEIFDFNKQSTLCMSGFTHLCSAIKLLQMVSWAKIEGAPTVVMGF